MIALFLLFMVSGNLHSQWHSQNTGVTSQLRSVYFKDQNTGWACGFDAVVKTTNGGGDWQATNIAGDHRWIAFLNSSTGYVCGGAGKFLRTTNEGESWQALNTGFNVRHNQIGIAPDGKIIIPSNGSVILRSTDSGITWQNILNIPAFVDFFSVKILNDSTYIISGNESVILRTTNDGSTWENISIGMPNPLFAVEFAGQQTGWVTGCCGMFMRTTNAGISWTTDLYLTPGYTLFDMEFRNPIKGWVIGEAGYILRTTNAGVNWDSLVTGTQLDLFSVSFADENTGYACGHNGTMLKTTNGGGPGTPIGIEASTVSADEFSLEQNYPNPFNPYTTITFTLKTASEVELVVYDAGGKKAVTLQSGRRSSGNHSAVFNGSQFASGIYYYSLRVGRTTVATKKMALIK